MAQIWAVHVPARARLVPLGSVGALPKLTVDEWLAVTAVVGGLGSALGLYLFATGREKEAYALGIAGAIGGAFVGAAKLLSDVG